MRAQQKQRTDWLYVLGFIDFLISMAVLSYFSLRLWYVWVDNPEWSVMFLAHSEPRLFVGWIASLVAWLFARAIVLGDKE